MNILIGQNHFDSVGGSETFSHTLAKAMQKFGKVDVATMRPGILSEEFNVNNFGDHYEHAFISHFPVVEKVKDLQIDNLVQIIHGTIPQQEKPHPSAKHVVISKEIANHYGQPMPVMRNIIDTHRFRPFRTRKHLKRVLSLSQSEKFNRRLKMICEQMGLEFHSYNKNSNFKIDIADEMRKFDLVVSIGRGVYEAMSCGLNVLVADERHYQQPMADGLLTPDNFDEFVSRNCSGRTSCIYPDDAFIADALLNYDKTFGDAFREIALAEYAPNVVCEKLLNLY